MGCPFRIDSVPLPRKPRPRSSRGGEDRFARAGDLRGRRRRAAWPKAAGQRYRPFRAARRVRRPKFAVDSAAVELVADAALTVALGGIVPHNETGKALVVHNVETAQPIGDLFGVGVRYAFFRELIEQHSARYVATLQNLQRALFGFVVHQPSKSSAEISMARPAAMAALRACGVSSLWALARMSASILSATSGFDSRYSLTLSLP